MSYPAKHTSSYSNQTKHTAIYSSTPKTVTNYFILLENGLYLLLESGGKIVLDQFSGFTSYSYQVKH